MSRMRATNSSLILLSPDTYQIGWEDKILDKYGNPSIVFAADIHLRATSPLCRIDNFRKTQTNKLRFLFNVANDLCVEEVIIAGDFGHFPFWPNELLTNTIDMIRTLNEIEIAIIPGQHDLPQHRLERYQDGALGVLEAAQMVNVLCDPYPYVDHSFQNFELHPFPFGCDIEHDYCPKEKLRNVAIAHMMVIENIPLWPGQVAPKGKTLLEKFPEYDLIVTGDNHNPFVIEHEGRLHINPGSMMRQKSDQINHRPRFYLWWAKTNQCMPIFWEIDKDAVTREHIEASEEIDERINQFVSKLITDEENIDVDFQENLIKFIAKQPKLSKKTIDRIWEAVSSWNKESNK